MTSLLDEMLAARGSWTGARLTDWYPDGQLARRIREAMQGQANWVADAEFGRSFRDNIASVPVTDPLAWANRRIELPDGHWCVLRLPLLST